MATSDLGRLIDPATVRTLVDAAVAAIPGAAISVRDADGIELGQAGSADPEAGHRVGGVERAIVVDGRPLGTVVVHADGSGPAEGLAALLATSLSTTATEAAARRAVAAAAILDLRELSLLSRLAETVGGAVEPASIGSLVLDAIARPLRADVGAVLGPPDGTADRVIAGHGTAADVARAISDARPVLERLHAEDPIQGTCADLGDPADGRADAGGPFGSILAAVVRTSSGTQGSIALARLRGSPPFDDADRRLLAAAASQTGIALERGALQHEILARRRLDDELAIGRRIQRSLMPRRFPELAGWEIAAAYEAAREVGGDFYDVFPLRDRPGRLAFTIADVTGKGIPAAILMADTRALIHAAADHATEPAESLARVNRVLLEERATSLFVSVAHGVVDGTSGDVSFASAGHDPVHVVRSSGPLTTLETGGRMMGMVADVQARAIRTNVGRGDALVAHTDGVTEARSPDGGFYGEDRFETLLASLAGRSATAIVDAVVADVTAFRNGAEASDDLTLLVLRRLPDAVASGGAADPPSADSSGDPG